MADSMTHSCSQTCIDSYNLIYTYSLSKWAGIYMYAELYVYTSLNEYLYTQNLVHLPLTNRWPHPTDLPDESGVRGIPVI